MSLSSAWTVITDGMINIHRAFNWLVDQIEDGHASARRKKKGLVDQVRDGHGAPQVK